MEIYIGLNESLGIMGFLVVIAIVFFMQRREIYYLDYKLKKYQNKFFLEKEKTRLLDKLKTPT